MGCKNCYIFNICIFNDILKRVFGVNEVYFQKENVT